MNVARIAAHFVMNILFYSIEKHLRSNSKFLGGFEDKPWKVCSSLNTCQVLHHANAKNTVLSFCAFA